MSKLICGIGINDLDHPTFVQGRMDPYYKRWSCMLSRASEKRWASQPAYIGTTVCDDWLHLSKFKEWVQSQEQQFGGDNIADRELDKDLLFKANKVYSPDTCCFILKSTNLFLTNGTMSKKTNPLGVSWSTKTRKFISSIRIHGKQEYLGQFDVAWEAHLAWLTKKRELAVEVSQRECDKRAVVAVLDYYHTDPFIY